VGGLQLNHRKLRLGFLKYFFGFLYAEGFVGFVFEETDGFPLILIPDPSFETAERPGLAAGEIIAEFQFFQWFIGQMEHGVSR
jgi:hypothetical protein